MLQAKWLILEKAAGSQIKPTNSLLTRLLSARVRSKKKKRRREVLPKKENSLSPPRLKRLLSPPN
jgi:hypothetical protein